MFKEVPLPPRPAIPLSFYCLASVIAMERLALRFSWETGVVLVAGVLASVCGGLLALVLARSGRTQVGMAAAVVVLVGSLGALLGSAAGARVASAAEELGSSPVSAWEFEIEADMSPSDSGWRGRAKGVSGAGEAAGVWLSSPERLHRGVRARVVGRFTPNSADERGTSNRMQGVCGSVKALRVLGSEEARGAYGAILRVRRVVLGSFTAGAASDEGDRGSELGDAAGATAGNEAARALLEGLLCGYSPDLKALGLDEEFSAAGASHMLAVSGAHLVVISAFIAAALQRTPLREEGRLVLLLGVTAVFVVLCGAPPSAVRGWLMSLVSQGARLAGRRGHSLSAVSLVGLAMALADPTVSGQLGFLLSVSCVAGIALFGGYAKHVVIVALGRPRPPRWVPRPLKGPMRGLLTGATDSLALTLVCQAVSLPLTASAFGELSVVAPLANVPLSVLFGPLVSLGLLCALACPAPLTQSALLAAFDVLGRVFIAVVELFAGLPHARVVLGGDAGAMGALLLVLAALLLIAWPRVTRWRLFAVGGVICFLTCSSFVRWRFFAPARICVMDVGQADAILLTDGSSSLMVDAGLDDEVASALARNHVSHLDAVVLTHLDQDHVGGLDDLQGIVTVGDVYLAKGVASLMTPELASAIERLCGHGPVELVYGDALTCGGFLARVVWPREPVSGEDGNGDSVVLRVGFSKGGRSLQALLTGDAEGEQLGQVLAAGDVGDIDFLKVGHHGSAVSVDESQAAQLAAEVAVASAGEGNRYGHPRAECIEALEAAGTRFLCTIDAGDVTVEPGASGPVVSAQKRTLTVE